MMKVGINRMLINICSSDLKKSKDFYTRWFEFKVAFDSDWFVQLSNAEDGLEIGIINKENDLLPKGLEAHQNGFYLTFVIEDVDRFFEEIRKSEIEIIQEPMDTFYGQRRMIIKDPDGTFIDVSSLMKK